MRDGQTTTISYDSSGRITQANIGGGTPRTVNYTTDVAGQIMRRYDPNGGYPLYNYYYYLNGVQVGAAGNDGAPEQDYSATIARYNFIQTNGYTYNAETGYADFDESYEPINGNEAMTAGRYTVRAGDTLQTIAMQVWGDSSLWYVLADANGMDGSTELAEGMSLVIPNKVENVHNNVSTFKPYDPNKAIGNILPSPIPPKPDKHHCGLAQIFVAIIAIVVIAVVAPHLIAAVASTLSGTTVTAATVSAALTGGTAIAGVSGAVSTASMVVGGALAVASVSRQAQRFPRCKRAVEIECQALQASYRAAEVWSKSISDTHPFQLYFLNLWFFGNPSNSDRVVFVGVPNGKFFSIEAKADCLAAVCEHALASQYLERQRRVSTLQDHLGAPASRTYWERPTFNGNLSMLRRSAASRKPKLSGARRDAGQV